METKKQKALGAFFKFISISKRNKLFNSYILTAIIFGAFFVMVGGCYFYIRNFQREHLLIHSREKATYIERIIGYELGNTKMWDDIINEETINHEILNMKFTSHAYGFLLDEDLNIVIHPNPDLLGMPINQENYGIELRDAIIENGNIDEFILTDLNGKPSIAYVKKISNGYSLAMITPVDEYFSAVEYVKWLLFSLATTIALILSLIVIRIFNKKEKAESRAASSEQSFNVMKNILNGLDALVYVTDPKTDEFLFLNDTFKEHFKITDEWLGRKCYHLLGYNERCPFCPKPKLEKDPMKPVIWLRESEKTKRTYQKTDRYEDLDGNVVHIQQSIDLTDMLAAKKLAESSNNAKSKFLATMSHEIRTPINAIMGIAAIQMENEKLPEETKEAVSVIYNSVDLLLGIINDILDLSKIDSGRMEIIPKEYDVSSLLYDTANLNVMRSKKSIKFNLNVDENVPAKLIGDELRIKQILNNLLSNAFKYTDKGEVTFSVWIEKNAKQNIGEILLHLSVSDTGDGMTQENVDKLFDEYYRIKDSLSNGTGLGLPITQKLVEMMNGKIEVKSEKGVGSIFSVCIPQKISDGRILGKEIVDNLKSFRSNKSYSRKTEINREYMPYGSILVVDDVETNLYVAQKLMEPYGLKTDVAESGFQAIDKIKEGKIYDIIFMDHMMPEMDGIETETIIRKLGYKNPIIALTANVVFGQEEIFMQAGFDGLLAKPIDLRQLDNLLKKYIHDKQTPEILEKAQKDRETTHILTDFVSGLDNKLVKLFTRDSQKVISVMEEVLKNIDSASDGDLNKFKISAHSMKSALANIGEIELSKKAFELEKAGKVKDKETIRTQTQEFIDFIKSVIVRINGNTLPTDIPTPNSEDKEFLREKLNIVCKACDAYDEKSANAALTELNNKSWTAKTKEFIDKIFDDLLHSEFEVASQKIKEHYANM